MTADSTREEKYLWRRQGGRAVLGGSPSCLQYFPLVTIAISKGGKYTSTFYFPLCNSETQQLSTS